MLKLTASACTHALGRACQWRHQSCNGCVVKCCRANV